MDLIQPRLPLHRADEGFKGYHFEAYEYNGWVYELPKGSYLAVIGSCPSPEAKNGASPADFLFRVRGQNFKMTQLK